MKRTPHRKQGTAATPPAGGLVNWLLDRLRRVPRPQQRLALLERIALAPRQSLALVEAEGRRILVATSPEGAPTFYPLGGHELPARRAHPLRLPGSARRISW
jgi:Flagellar biosynthesis protein, FliO